MALSLKKSQRRSQVEICHWAADPNARSAEARAVCFNVVSTDTPGRSECGALHRLLQARELCCHCVFENGCCWRQCPSVNNVMPRLEYCTGRAYVARWPTMEKSRWKAIISTWSPVEPNASWELLGGQLLALNRGRKMCAGRERQEIRHRW